MAGSYKPLYKDLYAAIALEFCNAILQCHQSHSVAKKKAVCKLQHKFGGGGVSGTGDQAQALRIPQPINLLGNISQAQVKQEDVSR